MEEGFIPPILDLSLLDSRMMVQSQDAFHMTRDLLKLDRGVPRSSGQLLAVLLQVVFDGRHGCPCQGRLK